MKTAWVARSKIDGEVLFQLFTNEDLAIAQAVELAMEFNPRAGSGAYEATIRKDGFLQIGWCVYAVYEVNINEG